MSPYPYLPPGRSFLFVSATVPYMTEAREHAHAHSLDVHMPTGAVIVRDGKVVAHGANGSDYHKTHGCERVRQGIPTGQSYELCEGCHPKNHSEARAILNAKACAVNTNGADLYLWGHWWACEPCWNAMIEGGIKNVYLQEGSEELFNKPRVRSDI